MTVVTQLNELAKKMTGVDPKATTDEVALDFIEQNFNGGGDTGTITLHFNEYGQVVDEDNLQKLSIIKKCMDENKAVNATLLYDDGMYNLCYPKVFYKYEDDTIVYELVFWSLGEDLIISGLDEQGEFKWFFDHN